MGITCAIFGVDEVYEKVRRFTLALWSPEQSSREGSSLNHEVVFKDQGVAPSFSLWLPSLRGWWVWLRERVTSLSPDGWWGCPWRGHKVKTLPIPPVRSGPEFGVGVGR